MGLEVIQELKKKKGLTIEELSALSGVPIGTLNKILSGQTKDPKLETLKAISRVLGCTLDDFDDPKDPDQAKTFTESELQLIEKYRLLDEHGKDLVETVAEKEYLRLLDEEKNTVVIDGDFLKGLPIEKRLGLIGDEEEVELRRVARKK